MVRLINSKNIDIFATAVYKLMRLQEFFTHIFSFNTPDIEPCIYVMWHANQLLVHGLKNRARTSILISNSADGEIVARAVEKWGFKVVRGSAGKKGAVESTMQMLARLKAGESVGIMVDGPQGPLHKVKNGAVKLAQMSGAPIIPAYWYSPQKTFVSLPSWDKLKVPVGNCNILNLYGEPIYVNSDVSPDEFNQIKEQIKTTLLDLEAKAPKLYNEAVKNKAWQRK